jgi:hypothetical protein
MDYVGLSKGFLTGWNDTIKLLNSFYVNYGLSTEFKAKELGFSLVLLNLYGPYENKLGY